MRAIIYCRVSSDTSGRGKSVSEQEKECRDVAAREDWDVAEVLVDNDVGASRYSRGERPAYDRLRGILAAGDVLVTWEASRAQRDLRAYLDLRELCAERGILWCYSGKIHDLSRGDDRFATGLDALLAEKEVEQTRDRVLRAVRATREAGRPHGKLAYGYRIIRDEHTGRSITRVPDPDTAPIVREVVRRLLAGETIYSVCRDLNAREVPPPRPRRDGTVGAWIPTTLREIARNPTYAGLVTHRKKIVGEGVWEPIITRDEHERLAAVLSDPSRTTRPPRGSQPRWLLTGIAECGHCGAPMTKISNRGATSYMCKGNQPTGGRRFCVCRVMHKVDPFVTESVLRRLEGQDLVTDRASSDADYAAAVEEVRALRQRLDGFVTAAAAGEVSPVSLARIEATLMPKIEAAEQRARARVSSPIVAAMMGPDARARWDDLSLMRRRDLIRAMVEIKIFRIGTGRRIYPAGEGIELTWK
ncbi:recombinase family protein [Gordonia sp. PP30]|uniref:recombinase family protein n=1 Tax=Gordonia sp. PP30 TaxID=2935861 RepID=UPI001FFF434D|nr:recombinase family protein [Gordonia sp. PP30]UQE73879.1 recombinase family protein [Gordonia sp. PP30]